MVVPGEEPPGLTAPSNLGAMPTSIGLSPGRVRGGMKQEKVSVGRRFGTLGTTHILMSMVFPPLPGSLEKPSASEPALLSSFLETILVRWAPLNLRRETPPMPVRMACLG